MPYQLVRKEVEVRERAATVAYFFSARRVEVAAHVRSFERGRHTTLREHMPRSHRAYAWCLVTARRSPTRVLSPRPDLCA